MRLAWFSSCTDQRGVVAIFPSGKVARAWGLAGSALSFGTELLDIQLSSRFCKRLGAHFPIPKERCRLSRCSWTKI